MFKGNASRHLAEAASSPMKTPDARRPKGKSGLVIAIIAALTYVISLSHAYAADLPGTFIGSAFATFASAQAGPIATELGRTAVVSCSCRGTSGKTITNTTDTISGGVGGSVLTAATATSTVLTTKTATSAEVQDNSTISGLNLFSGLITADTIKAAADVAATASTITPSSAGSMLVNLKIGGTSIAANTAPNTVVALPGIGTVTIYRVVKSGAFVTSGQITVDMLYIKVGTANSFGLPVGTTIIVTQAVAGFNRAQPAAIVSGNAYVASANAAIGPVLQNEIGKIALVSIPCLGTNGRILTNSVNTTTVAGVLTLASGMSTAFGGPQSGGTIAQTTSTVEGLGLLGGVISASTITSETTSTLSNGVVSNSTAGTSFAGLKIGLLTVPVDVPPNTELTVPGFGTVIVNEQVIPKAGSAASVQVNGLHLTIDTTNVLGLPIGSEIIIAHAQANTAAF